MMRKIFTSGLLLLLFSGMLCAETFSYKFVAGDKYHILSTVDEDVYINGKFDHRSRILNRIAVTVESADGRQSAVYQTAEEATRQNTAAGQGQSLYQWENEYTSSFTQNAQGFITAIDPGLYMPQDRNCPVFPLQDGKARDLTRGAVWSAKGEEVHDFRANFGIKAPYHIPFTANYIYLGPQNYDYAAKQPASYPAISVDYRIFARPKLSSGEKTILPFQILGRSTEIVYWNSEKGRPAAYKESFRLIFTMNNGVTIEYRGNAHAEVTESQSMDKDDLLKSISKELGPEKNTSVEKTSKGVKITLQNINFDPNSAVLRPEDAAKLETIAKILQKESGRDLLIEGYCAKAGAEDLAQTLSEQRAATVAGFLVDKGVRTSEHIITRGYGDKHPLADNSTEAGRAQNRRVEITILEN
jgi:outer membrane protein OmpA-like peptidoglycan-associated protein